MARAKRQTPRPRRPSPPEKGRKRGYRSDRNMDLGKSQSIEELTSGLIKKKS